MISIPKTLDLAGKNMIFILDHNPVVKLHVSYRNHTVVYCKNISISKSMEKLRDAGVVGALGIKGSLHHTLRHAETNSGIA